MSGLSLLSDVLFTDWVVTATVDFILCGLIYFLPYFVNLQNFLVIGIDLSEVKYQRCVSLKCNITINHFE